LHALRLRNAVTLRVVDAEAAQHLDDLGFLGPFGDRRGEFYVTQCGYYCDAGDKDYADRQGIVAPLRSSAASCRGSSMAYCARVVRATRHAAENATPPPALG
jgi:hypothetical protein